MPAHDPFEGWTVNPGASREVVEALPPAIRSALPAEYLALLQRMNGGEGFLGQDYIRFYPADRIGPLNEAYRIQAWLPDHILIGSDGAGTAYLLAGDGAVIECPFIPMARPFAKTKAPDFGALLRVPTSGASRPTLNPAYLGKEVHEIQPLIFGGDPCDPANKVALTAEKHAEAVVWWNLKYRETTDPPAV